MKKACLFNKYYLLLVMIACLLFFNTSCGLDTFYVLDPPISIIHQPEYSNESQDSKYFEFWTNENTQIEGFTFLGTEVYYKIYNSYSQMTSETSVLQTLSNDADKSATAAEKMINNTSSGGYGFKALKVAGNPESPLVTASDSNQRVYIRLSDYQNVEDYSARVLVNGANLNGAAGKTIPVRNTSDMRTFNFGRNGSYDIAPAKDDEDVKFTSGVTSSKWYVCMFAASLGMDATYQNYYSNILYLGSVSIDASSYDN